MQVYCGQACNQKIITLSDEWDDGIENNNHYDNNTEILIYWYNDRMTHTDFLSTDTEIDTAKLICCYVLLMKINWLILTFWVQMLILICWYWKRYIDWSEKLICCYEYADKDNMYDTACLSTNADIDMLTLKVIQRLIKWLTFCLCGRICARRSPSIEKLADVIAAFWRELLALTFTSS